MKRLSMPRLMLSCALNAVLASVFCQILNVGSAFITTQWWSRAIVLICDVGLYISLLYASMWKHGDKDHNLAAFGHIKPDLYRGFVAAVPVSAFYFVLSVLMILEKLSIVPSYFLYSFRLLCPQLMQLYNIQLPLKEQFTSGTLTAISWPLLLICCLLSVLLPLITYGVAFLFGYRGVQLGDRLVYQKKKMD